MLVGKPVSQTWTLGEKRIFKLAGFEHVALGGGALMHSDAAKETEVVLVRVQGQHPVLVAKPIREIDQEIEGAGPRLP